MNQTGNTKNTNCVGQWGCGREHQQLGRETYIDQIIAREGESLGSRATSHQGTGSQQLGIQQSLPHLELSRESVSEESWIEWPLEDNLEHLEDQGSVAKPHIEYQHFGWPVTQEEWEKYNVERRRREVEAENRRNMDRKERIPKEHEAENEETVPTLEFPIRITPGNHPMKKIPLSALPNFHCLASEDPNEFLFEFDILYISYDYISDT